MYPQWMATQISNTYRREAMLRRECDKISAYWAERRKAEAEKAAQTKQ